MNAGLTAVSWLDWKLGARLLLKYPALTIIGGLSLAARHRDWGGRHRSRRRTAVQTAAVR